MRKSKTYKEALEKITEQDSEITDKISELNPSVHCIQISDDDIQMGSNLRSNNEMQMGSIKSKSCRVDSKLESAP